MGEGDHYNEEDIRQIAKALTGYRLDNHSGKLIFKQQSHDSSQKNILGNVGYHKLEGVLDIILDHPQTALFISRKF